MAAQADLPQGSVLLSTAFCPPVEYFAILAGYSSVYLEACETYCKQSWRNRCRILTANGPMDLSFPVVHASMGQSIDRVEVEYSTPWVPKMERAIESAYFSSPFFEYYRDALFAILDSHPATLWSLNMQIVSWLCAKIGIDVQIVPTTSFVRPHETSGGMADYRDAIHPKTPNTILHDLGLERPYWQVFESKFGFTGGLSVLDLLFNQGPESLLWLRCGPHCR